MFDGVVEENSVVREEIGVERDGEDNPVVDVVTEVALVLVEVEVKVAELAVDLVEVGAGLVNPPYTQTPSVPRGIGGP